MTPPETRKGFHDELAEVNQEVVELAAMATNAIEAGTDALLSGDIAAVEQIIENDKLIDRKQHEIEDRVSSLLALQAPLGVDLRVLISVLRIIHEIERIGDNMENVAKATRRLYPAELDPRVRGIVQRMREQAINQLATAVQSFVERDPQRAAALYDMDDVMDDLQKELFRVIFSSEVSEESLQRGVQIALIGRYFERIADHAVNFAERVSYMVTGQSPKS